MPSRVEGAGVLGAVGLVGRRRQARRDAGAEPIRESVPQQRRGQAIDAGRLQAEHGGRFHDRVAWRGRGPGHAAILRALRPDALDGRLCRDYARRMTRQAVSATAATLVIGLAAGVLVAQQAAPSAAAVLRR